MADASDALVACAQGLSSPLGQQPPQPMQANFTCLRCRFCALPALPCRQGVGIPTFTYRVRLGDDMVQKDVAQGGAGQQLSGCDVEGGQVLSKGRVGGGKHRQGRVAASGDGSGYVGQQSCRQADMRPSTPLSSVHIWCAKHCVQSAGVLRVPHAALETEQTTGIPQENPKVCVKPCVQSAQLSGLLCRPTRLQGAVHARPDISSMLQQPAAALGSRSWFAGAGVGDCKCMPHASAAASSSAGQQGLAGWAA